MWMMVVYSKQMMIMVLVIETEIVIYIYTIPLTCRGMHSGVVPRVVCMLRCCGSSRIVGLFYFREKPLSYDYNEKYNTLSKTRSFMRAMYMLYVMYY